MDGAADIQEAIDDDVRLERPHGVRGAPCRVELLAHSAVVEQVHQLIDLEGRLANHEDHAQDDRRPGVPAVGLLESGLPAPADLHQQGDQREYHDHGREEEGDEDVGHGDLVPVRVAVAAVPDVAGLGAGAAVVVVAGHRPGRDGEAEADHEGQRNGPLVHPRLPDHRVAVLGHVGLLLAIPKVQEQEEEDQHKCVGRHHRVVEEGVQLARDVAGLPLHDVDRLAVDDERDHGDRDDEVADGQDREHEVVRSPEVEVLFDRG